MRSVLLRLDLARPWSGWDDPMLGAGWVWLAVGLIWIAVRVARGTKWTIDDTFNFGLFAAAALVGGFVLPARGLESIPLFGYGLSVLVGFLAGTWLARRRLRSVGWPDDLAYRVGFWILLSGVAGARLFWLLQHGRDGFAGKSLPQAIGYAVNLSAGGLVLYGGVIAGAIAFFAFCWRYRLPVLRFADVLTPSVLVGIGFGRIGCLLNGCCFGDACELPWAITFPADANPYQVLVSRGFLERGQTLPLHPTQIYSTITAFLLAAATSLYFWRRSRDGSVLALGLVGYAIGRFVVEFLRGDELGQFGTSLTISQWISLGMFAAGLGLATWLSRRERAAAPPQEAEIPVAAA